MSSDLNIISHIALDDKIFFTEKKERKVMNQLGGPVSYASCVLPILPIKGRCITSIGKDFPKEYQDYLSQLRNCSFEYRHSEKTTRFLHKIYPESRTLYLLERANNLDDFLREFPNSKGCLVSPVYKEISQESVDWICRENDYVGIDVQGFMRGIDTNNKIIFNYEPEQLSELVRKATIVKFSLNEAMHYTQEKSLTEILNKLPSHNIQIVTMGESGLIFSQNGGYYRLKAPNIIERDPTGAGDVMMTGMLAKLIKCNEFKFSISFGMALASKKVQMTELEVLPQINYTEIAEEIMESLERLE